MNIDVNGLIEEIKKHSGGNLSGILGSLGSLGGLTNGAVDISKLKEMNPEELIKTAQSFGIDISKFTKK